METMNTFSDSPFVEKYVPVNPERPTQLEIAPAVHVTGTVMRATGQGVWGSGSG